VKRIDHVGIAVGDLAEARRIWDLVLGQEPDCDEVPTQKVETAMYPCGIELVAPTSEESPISKFLARLGAGTGGGTSGGGGIHHVTVEVDDIDAHLARLKKAGVRLINETPTPGHGGCRVAFLHPASTGGVLVELKEQS
jgi:methylmalonyl-CoA/ethylmalonyl-CoA epimerase